MIHSRWWFVRDDHRGGLGAARPIGPVPSGSFVIRKRAWSRRRPGSRRGRTSVSGPRLRRRRRDRDDALLDQGRGLELVIKAAGLRGVDRRGHDVNALGAARFGGFARGAAGARSDPNGSRGRAAHTACAKLRGARRRRRSTRHGRLDERRLATRLKPRLAVNQILSALRHGETVAGGDQAWEDETGRYRLFVHAQPGNDRVADEAGITKGRLPTRATAAERSCPVRLHMRLLHPAP